MNAPTCGSLFSGIGLLDAGLHLAGWQHRWLCESDEWRRSVLRKRFPGAVVYDDVRTLRGPLAADSERDGVREQSVAVAGRSGAAVAGRAGEAAAYAAGGPARRNAALGAGRLAAEPERSAGDAEPVTLVAGGFPCKGASTAGKRQGFGHAETVLWHEMRRIVGELSPRYVVIENVSNILGMAAAPGEPAGSLWGSVLADLAALGYDTVWDCVPAGAVGAPHLRDRVFCVAVASDADKAGRLERGGRGAAAPQHTAAERDGADVADAARHGERGASGQGGADGERARPRADDAVAVDWGDYRPAIDRWAAIHGEAPAPLVSRVRGVANGRSDVQRLRARLDRQRLSSLGDAVHAYVGWLVGEYVMGLEHERLAAAMDDQS